MFNLTQKMVISVITTFVAVMGFGPVASNLGHNIAFAESKLPVKQPLYHSINHKLLFCKISSISCISMGDFDHINIHPLKWKIEP